MMAARRVGSGTGTMPELRASMREEPHGRWVATAGRVEEGSGATPGGGDVRLEADSREECLAALRRHLRPLRPEDDDPLVLIVETLPRLAGVAEAATVMGWDKRRVITYLNRGRFPDPVQSLASGRVWIRGDVERFADRWWARRGRSRP